MPEYLPIKTAVWDLETDGLLSQLTRIHLLVIRDFERHVTHVFRRNDHEDTIEIGLRLLAEAEENVGHNIIGFDMPAIEKVYGSPYNVGRMMDTLVMTRMCFANQKDKDFRLQEKGVLPGKFIGQHTLKAWGYRLNMHKGDYADVYEQKAKDLGITDEDEIRKFVWGTWNQDMEDYAVQDVEVTTMLYQQVIDSKWANSARILEHRIHQWMAWQEENGIPFNIEAAEKLTAELQGEADKLHAEAVASFGHWYAPEKKHQVKMVWDDPDGVNKEKTYETPALEFGEDYSRAIWGTVTVPKKARNVTTQMPGNPEKGIYLDPMKFSYSPDAPYCKVVLKEFNPGSRPQIIDRLVQNHNWHPVDFTEKGNPEVSDSVLRKLPHIPVAIGLAELFYYTKRLGQIATGPQAWLKKVQEDGNIHHYCNVGGTISGRGAHIGPNLGQVPAVMIKEYKVVTGETRPGSIIMPDGVSPTGRLLTPDAIMAAGGRFTLEDYYYEKLRKQIAMGRDGDHGWECRDLFGFHPNVDERFRDWMMVGIDLKGIELRCFGAQLAKFDKGAYLDIILNQDPHAYNQKAAGLPTRAHAKTFIYACVPMDTLALTRRGWVGYEDLQVGEDVLTYNAETKMKEWKPVLEKVFYPDAPVIEMTNKHTFSVRCTPNHRWFTWRRQRVNGYKKPPRYQVLEAQSLHQENNIIVNAPMAPGEDVAPWDDANFHHDAKYGTDWSHQVMQMTQRERQAWLSGFCLADGHHQPTGPNKKNWCWKWSQNEGEIASAATLASYLVWDGRFILNSKVNPLNGRTMILGAETKRPYVTCQRMQKIEHPNQPVWCIRTENESWVIRQGDTITITGNTIYGGGDVKLGSIVAPLADEEEQRRIGKKLREMFLQNVPAFAAVVREIQGWAKQGWLPGLDGRRLFVRSPHSALNTKLQSDAALISKQWILMMHDRLQDQLGLVHGWDGDYTQLLWIHDEVQLGARPGKSQSDGLANEIAYNARQAAEDAGKFFNYGAPVEADSKVAKTWSGTH